MRWLDEGVGVLLQGGVRGGGGGGRGWAQQVVPETEVLALRRIYEDMNGVN